MRTKEEDEDREIDEEFRVCGTCRYEGCNKEEDPCKSCLNPGVKFNGYES